MSDAEGFQEILFALERIGALRLGRTADLGKCEKTFSELAAASVLGFDIPASHSDCHTSFDRLYSLVRIARNDALHQGAFARNLTRHAVELCLVLEDALMTKATTVSDFMVRNPICAELWQPLSLVRQQMLAHSFSYLPVHLNDGSWGIVADLAIARALARTAGNGDRNEALARTLGDAVTGANPMEILPATTVAPEDSIASALDRCDGHPLLVLDKQHRLVGILTPFDLL